MWEDKYGNSLHYVLNVGRETVLPFWILVACALDGVRGWYSSKFYQSIDWPCYSLDGERLLEGDFDYQK